MQTNHADTFDQVLSHYNVIKHFMAHSCQVYWTHTCDQLQTVTQNGNKVSTLQTSHPQSSWCSAKMKPEETKLPPKSSNSHFFSITNLNSLLPQLREELTLLTLWFYPASRELRRCWQPTHDIIATQSKAFWLRTLINKFNHLERPACIPWWHFLDQRLVTGGIIHQSQWTPAFF